MADIVCVCGGGVRMFLQWPVDGKVFCIGVLGQLIDDNDTLSQPIALGDVCFGVNMVSSAHDVRTETHPEWTVDSEASVADKLNRVCGLGPVHRR